MAYTSKSNSTIQISSHKRGTNVSLTLKNVKASDSTNGSSNYYKISYNNNNSTKDENDNEVIAQPMINASKYNNENVNFQKKNIISTTRIDDNKNGKSAGTKIKNPTKSEGADKSSISTDKKSGRVSSIRAKFQVDSSSDESKPEIKPQAQKKTTRTLTQEKPSTLTSKFSSYQKPTEKNLNSTKRGSIISKTYDEKKSISENPHVDTRGFAKGGKKKMPLEQVPTTFISDFQNIQTKNTEVQKMTSKCPSEPSDIISPFVRVIIQDPYRLKHKDNEKAEKDGMKVTNFSTGYMRYNYDGRIDSQKSVTKVPNKSGKQLLHSSISSPFVKTVYQDCKSPSIIRKQIQKSGRNLSDYDESVIVSTANCSREQTQKNHIHFRRIRRSRSERYKSDPLDVMGKTQSKDRMNNYMVDRWGQQRSSGNYESASHCRSENQTVIYRSNSLDNLFSLIKTKSNRPYDHGTYQNNNGTRSFNVSNDETDAVIIERAKMVRLDTAKTLLDGATSPNSIRRSNLLTARRESAANRLSFGLIANERIIESDESEILIEQNHCFRENNSQIPSFNKSELKTSKFTTSLKKNNENNSTSSNLKLKSTQPNSDQANSVGARLKQFEIVSAKQPSRIESNKAIVHKLQRYKTFDYGEISTTAMVNDHIRNANEKSADNILVGTRNKSEDKDITIPLNVGATIVLKHEKIDHISADSITESESDPPKVSNLRSLFEIEGSELRRTKSWRPSRSKKPKESASTYPCDSNTALEIQRPSSTDGIRSSKKIRFENKSTITQAMPYDSKTKDKQHEKALHLLSQEVQKEIVAISTRNTSEEEIDDVEINYTDDNKSFVRKGSERRSRQSFVVDNVLYASPGEELYISSGFHSLPGRHRHGRDDSDSGSQVNTPSGHPEVFTHKPVKLRFDLNDHKQLAYSSSDTNLNSSRRSYELQSHRKDNHDRHSVIESVHPRSEIGSFKEDVSNQSSNVALVAPMVFESTEEKVDADKENKRTEKQFSEDVSTAKSPIIREPKQLRFEIVVGNTEQTISYDVNSEDLKDTSTTWHEFESRLKKAFDNHVQTIDANYLEIKSTDIRSLKIGRHEVALGENFDLNSIRRERVCQIHLQDTSTQLASLSYETLLPKSHIAKFLSLILTNHFVIFYGPSGTGKSYFARKLVQLLERRLISDGVDVDVVKVVNINKDKWQELVDGCLKNVNSKRPTVLLFDGLTHSFMRNVDQISHHLDRLEYKGIYVIGTVTQCGDVDVPVEWQKQFRWVWLPNHEEPVKGMLRRYLRREILQYNDRSQWQELFSLTEWLLCLWKHINSYIENYHSSELAIGPAMFFSCPINMDQAEEWFIDLWNYSIIPYFLHTVKKGVRVHGKIGTWEDPLNWILSTYPWRCHDNGEVSDASSKLKHIRLEDVGLSNPIEKQKPVPNDDQHRLMDFLRRLENFVEPTQSGTESGISSTLQNTQADTKYEASTRTRPYLESAL